MMYHIPLLALVFPLLGHGFTTQISNGRMVNDESRLIKFKNSESFTSLDALTTAELPDKLYFPQEKELPKVLGGIKIGVRKLVVVTGASSGLGLNAAATLAKTGRYFVVMACRDIKKGKRGKIHNENDLLIFYNIEKDREVSLILFLQILCKVTFSLTCCWFSLFDTSPVAKEMEMPDGSYSVLKLELASLQSIRDFVANLKAFKSARPLNNLICNAAVYLPTDPKPAFTDDGFEMSMVSKD